MCCWKNGQIILKNPKKKNIAVTVKIFCDCYIFNYLHKNTVKNWLKKRKNKDIEINMLTCYNKNNQSNVMLCYRKILYE